MTEQSQLIPMTPGERLQQARRDLAYTRSDVAARLKCSEAVVAALEEGGDAGVAAVYLQGFLKAYLRLLGLPDAEAERLMTEHRQSEPELRSVFPAATSNQPVDRWLRAASYVLGSLLVGTLAWQVSHEFVRLSQDDRDTVESGAPVKASISALESLVEERGLSAGAEAWAALDQSLEEGEHLISLTASADSWVEIADVNGALLEQDLVRGGSVRQYRGLGPYRITLGRTSAIELAIDGQPVNLQPYAQDDVTQMLLDPENLLAAAEEEQ